MTAPRTPTVVETHISTLFFVGDRVFKLAKRLELAFLQTIHPEQRIALASRELELNRRFAPDVYLGFADVVEHGELVDRMVVMRRLSPDRRLSTLLESGDASTCLRRVARLVAATHAAADPVTDQSVVSTTRLEQNWRDNFDALASHVDAIITEHDFDAVRRLAESYLEQTGDLRARRISDGFVRDGHGDLTADDIFCLDDGPRILDCLAFDDGLRIDDVLDDIAFLAMDVQRLAGPDQAMALMDAYHEFSNEQHPPSLAHHYVAYRAHVRAKVACLRAEQGDEDAADLARTYHDLSLHHLQRSRLRVVLIGGGPGVGKTVLSSAIADRYGYVHLATDEVRHDVTGIPHGTHAFSALDEGAYDPGLVDATYDEMCREARTLLDAGYGVVLDASWSAERHRETARSAVERHGIDPVEIECVLDASVARERIERRLAGPADPSDATPDLVDLRGPRREPWRRAHRLDTDVPVDDVVARAVTILEAVR